MAVCVTENNMKDNKSLPILFLIFFMIYSNSGEAVEKYKWQASESAPKNFPMKIVSGTLTTITNDLIYIPANSKIHLGWGLAISSHIVGDVLKSLPVKLQITFFSYTENIFYKGEFDLPYDKILALFKTGYYSQNIDADTTYTRIVTGVAPGGNVSVWLVGPNKTTQVFFGTAVKVDIDWRVINDNPNYSREEYVRLGVEEALSYEALHTLHDYGVPIKKWLIYQQKYLWNPKIIGMELRDKFINTVTYFNGELDYIYYPIKTESNKAKRAVPKDIRFVWKETNEQNTLYEIFFDESEIFDVFEKLNGSNDILELEIKLIKDNNQKKLSVALKNYNLDKGLYLNKFRLETYGAD